MSFPNKLHRSNHDAADVDATCNVSKLNKFEGIGEARNVSRCQDAGYTSRDIQLHCVNCLFNSKSSVLDKF